MDVLPSTMPSLTESLLSVHARNQVLFPPLCFALVLPGVYRSGHPNKMNLEHMDSLRLKSIMYLSTDDYRHDTRTWALDRGLNIFHYRTDVSKDPTIEVNEDLIAEALEEVLDVRNHPILIHDNKGRLLPSIISALLRLLTGWTLDAALTEYRMFLPPADNWVPEKEREGKPKKDKERIADIQFIEHFPLERLTYDPQHAPSWLKR
ncbi:hypothetical protein JCM1841_000058 [Sporobolomyces salmonicolor]